MLTYYNKDLFAEKGVPAPSLDWNNAITFDQVLNDCAALSGGEGANKTYGFNGGPYMAFIGMYSLSNSGHNVFDDEGNVTLTQPESLAVYHWFDDMLQKGYMPRPSDTQVISAFDMFATGRIGMLVDGSWSLASLYDYDEMNIGIAPVPSGNGQSYSAMYVDSFVVYKGTKNEEAAFDALNAMISTEGWNALAQTAFGGIPVNRIAFEENKDKFLPMGMDAEDLDVLISGLDHAVRVPYNEFYQEADYEANLAMDQWLLGMIGCEEYAEEVKGIVEKYAAESTLGK
jgi:ABC-type glycerol-3-phosphate transport system substrate-binding protein